MNSWIGFENTCCKVISSSCSDWKKRAMIRNRNLIACAFKYVSKPEVPCPGESF